MQVTRPSGTARHVAKATGIRVVQQILGHSQLSQTERYTHVTSALSQDAADRMAEALWASAGDSTATTIATKNDHEMCRSREDCRSEAF